jgi:hypothetical protein
MILQLPVSLGEALDKLSILDIKLENIKDDRKNDVQVEYNMLYELLLPYINKYNTLYTLMKDINSKLWNLLSEQRNPTLSIEEYGILSKKVVEENDARFRTKDKINILAQSVIKEKKGYDLTTKDIVISSNNYDDVIINILKESVYNDKLIVSFDESLQESVISKVRKYFSYDVSIKIL